MAWPGNGRHHFSLLFTSVRWSSTLWPHLTTLELGPRYPGGTAHTEQLAGITTVSRNNMFQISSKKIMVVLNEMLATLMVF